jgi:hypothetical protein
MAPERGLGRGLDEDKADGHCFRLAPLDVLGAQPACADAVAGAGRVHHDQVTGPADCDRVELLLAGVRPLDPTVEPGADGLVFHDQDALAD